MSHEVVMIGRERLFMCGNGGRSAIIRTNDRLRTNLGWQLISKGSYYTIPGARDVGLRGSYRPDSVLVVGHKLMHLDTLEATLEDTLEDVVQAEQPVEAVPESYAGPSELLGKQRKARHVEQKKKEKALLLLDSGVNPSLGHTSAVRAEMEIPKEQMEQRLNFNGDPSNPHSHDNGNGFNHFPPLDSGYALNHSVPRPLRKRPWHHSNQGTSPDQVDSANNVKVYVAPVPRTATEAEIRPVFEEHGTIIEVVLLKDKRTGVRQGSCFVKYATFDGADRAIKALNNQYTFVGESYPVVVKFADRELERLAALFTGACLYMLIDAEVSIVFFVFPASSFKGDKGEKREGLCSFNLFE
ncbi:hypothetical protein V8G54_020649 [Vigna mungo]|uniref:RRM domain-containing protein n=1 Tax=Vigna mungo TaxID=3915 RepID=A0AAQ3NEN2_VIGMU